MLIFVGQYRTQNTPDDTAKMDRNSIQHSLNRRIPKAHQDSGYKDIESVLANLVAESHQTSNISFATYVDNTATICANSEGFLRLL